VWEDIAKRYQKRKTEPVLELDAWKQTLDRVMGDRPDILWRCAVLHWEISEREHAIEYATKAFAAENFREFARRRIVDVPDDAWARLLPWVGWRYDMQATIEFSADLQDKMREYVYELGGGMGDQKSDDDDGEEDGGEEEDDGEDEGDDGDNDNDGAEKVLAAGWTSALDGEGGTYYYNEATRESTYEFPEAPPDDDDGNGEEGVPAQLPDGWESATDAEGGTYYFNVDTRESTYDFPKGKPKSKRAKEATPAANRLLPAGWESATDNTGATYYYNTSTRESVYEFPTDDGGTAAAEFVLPAEVAEAAPVDQAAQVLLNIRTD
jgi:hypothetical protein